MARCAVLLTILVLPARGEEYLRREAAKEDAIDRVRASLEMNLRDARGAVAGVEAAAEKHRGATAAHDPRRMLSGNWNGMAPAPFESFPRPPVSRG